MASSTFVGCLLRTGSSLVSTSSISESQGLFGLLGLFSFRPQSRQSSCIPTSCSPLLWVSELLWPRGTLSDLNGFQSVWLPPHQGASVWIPSFSLGLTMVNPILWLLTMAFGCLWRSPFLRPLLTAHALASFMSSMHRGGPPGSSGQS